MMESGETLTLGWYLLHRPVRPNHHPTPRSHIPSAADRIPTGHSRAPGQPVQTTTIQTQGVGNHSSLAFSDVRKAVSEAAADSHFGFAFPCSPQIDAKFSYRFAYAHGRMNTFWETSVNTKA